MIKIGITGSIASGKTTASKILSYRRGPLFSADEVVKRIYKNNNFKRILIKELKIEKKSSLKDALKKKILKNKKNIKKLRNAAKLQKKLGLKFMLDMDLIMIVLQFYPSSRRLRNLTLGISL